MLPGQQPPRVFMKGRGEITSKQQKTAIERASASTERDAERDPMGAIADILGSPGDEPDDAVDTTVEGPDAASVQPGEVPAPAPYVNGRATGGQPL
jgi:hypothetical protein